ncbi:MAG: hypothetical protein AB1671_01985 [Thermodesulfobacteriota bacterium]
MGSVGIGCHQPPSPWTFADFPRFREYRCSPASSEQPDEAARRLLRRFRPRLVVAPGAPWPIDFYRDYLPNAVLRDADQGGKIIATQVTREVLQKEEDRVHAYVDLVRIPDLRREGKRPAVYGRVYREPVFFSDGQGKRVSRRFTFLKYNVVFARSGLPAGLPWVYETALRLMGLDPEDWHELDNFCAIHMVLDEGEEPIAVLLAQHNHHRTYLIGPDLPLPSDGRIGFAAALRSNELYPDRGETVPTFHRAIPWPLYLEYLVSGENGPWFTADDITYGRSAGGEGVEYELQFLDPCDPFYTSRCMLGEYRPFFGLEIGRNGPPGADYYTLPELMPLGTLLKASCFRDGDDEDIQVVRAAVDPRRGRFDAARLIQHGEQKLYRRLLALREGGSRDATARRQVLRSRRPTMPTSGWAVCVSTTRDRAGAEDRRVQVQHIPRHASVRSLEKGECK